MPRIALHSCLLFVAASGLAACSGAGADLSSVATQAEALDAPAACSLSSTDGKLRHVVYVQFDNLHFSRDLPNVPSDLEQMPHLLSFITGGGTLLSNHHTPLISHTATDIVTSLTGLYPDRHGIAVSNSYRTFANGKSSYAPSFTYWTDPVSTTDTSYNLVGPGGKNAPAPWVAYTRAGCDFGAVSVANTVLENVAGDVTTVFGATSPEAQEAKSNPSQAVTDFEGIAIHCAKGSKLCGGDGARPDVLPDEAGGYAGYSALFGHVAVAPRIATAPLTDLDGAPIADESGRPGFPGFGGMTATRSLGYVATMLEAGVPVVYAYVSDAHDNHGGDGAFGPGEAGYVAQLAEYDAAFAKFFDRLAADGIDRSNTLFVFTADEGDHFVGGAPSPADCDGVKTPCTYSKLGEIDANLTGLLAQKGITTKLSIAQSQGIYVDGNPAPTDAATRALERAIGGLQIQSPITTENEPVSRFIADRTEMGLLHMTTADAARTPTFTMFVNPNLYVSTGAATCTDTAPCVTEQPGYAWNHGMVSRDVNVTWLGMVGPGVRHLAVDDDVWSDHADVRPTILALAGLSDDYVHQGRPLVEVLHERAVPRSARGRLVEALMRAYKRINAPVGPFSMATLRIADAAAKSGDANGDDRYLGTTALLASLAARRDALAKTMETAIDGAAFKGAPVHAEEAEALIAEGELLVAEAELLAAGL